MPIGLKHVSRDRIDKTVFILGAGASYGDTLVDFGDDKETTARIPLSNQFFRPEFLEGEIEVIKRDYSALLEYIKTDWNNNWPFGSGSWEHLNLEDVFTSLAIENEFAPSDTDGKAKAQLRLNSLKKYIREISRNIWSNALAILRSASKIVIIGYSFPATDFYSEWLLRTALKGYRDVKIWVVNPLNDSDKDDGSAFEERMSVITQHKKVTKYYRFDQINEVLAGVRSSSNCS